MFSFMSVFLFFVDYFRKLFLLFRVENAFFKLIAENAFPINFHTV